MAEAPLPPIEIGLCGDADAVEQPEEEKHLSRVAEEAEDDAPSGTDDLCRDVDDLIDEAPKLHPEQKLLLAPVLHSPSRRDG